MSIAKYLFTCIFFYSIFTTSSQGHSWYPYFCCGGQDCHPVACDTITETDKGFKYKNFTFEKTQNHPSQDSHCHVCISNEDGKILNYTPVTHCIFTLQGS